MSTSHSNSLYITERQVTSEVISLEAFDITSMDTLQNQWWSRSSLWLVGKIHPDWIIDSVKKCWNGKAKGGTRVHVEESHLGSLFLDAMVAKGEQPLASLS